MDFPDAGQEFVGWYPFYLGTYTEHDEDGRLEFKTWVPGVRDGFVPPDEAISVYDGIGKIILTVISVHKPGRFPHRVFFTRQWEDPAGRRFGKSACRVATLQKFRRLAKGYRHECRLATPQARTTDGDAS